MFVSSGLFPYAPQYRLNWPVVASITATRLLPYPSEMYASLFASSTKIFATWWNAHWSLLPEFAYAKPNCLTNLPSFVNFRTWLSLTSLPPIQTKPLPSTVTPWFEFGHSYPWPGPPHEEIRLPA